MFENSALVLESKGQSILCEGARAEWKAHLTATSIGTGERACARAAAETAWRAARRLADTLVMIVTEKGQ